MVTKSTGHVGLSDVATQVICQRSPTPKRCDSGQSGGRIVPTDIPETEFRDDLGRRRCRVCSLESTSVRLPLPEPQLVIASGDVRGCAKCREVKPVEEFTKGPRSGFKPWCITCMETYRRDRAGVPFEVSTDPKTCNSCDRVLDADSFRRNRSSAGGSPHRAWRLSLVLGHAFRAHNPAWWSWCRSERSL